MARTAKNTSSPFTMVRRSIWYSKRFTSLPNDDTRYLFSYFLYHPQQSSTGCFRLTAAHALADLATMNGADWTVAKYGDARAAILKNELIFVDDETNEILITRWWQDNGPNNESWFSGAQKQCEAIESSRLRKAAQDALKACWESYLASKLPTTPGGPREPTPFPDAAERLSALRSRRG